jgi:antitoxin component of RelBE/YafQ-DinJ toxin-antitoxin module
MTNSKQDKRFASTPFLSTRCSYELRDSAEAVAKERGWSLGKLVRVAVEQYLSSAVAPVEDSPRTVDGRSRSWLGK